MPVLERVGRWEAWPPAEFVNSGESYREVELRGKPASMTG